MNYKQSHRLPRKLYIILAIMSMGCVGFYIWNRNESKNNYIKNDLSNCEVAKKGESKSNSHQGGWKDECIFEIDGVKHVPAITIATDSSKKTEFTNFNQFQKSIEVWVSQNGGYVASSTDGLQWVSTVFPDTTIKKLKDLEAEAKKLPGVDWAYIDSITEMSLN